MAFHGFICNDGISCVQRQKRFLNSCIFMVEDFQYVLYNDCWWCGFGPVSTISCAEAVGGVRDAEKSVDFILQLVS